MERSGFAASEQSSAPALLPEVHSQGAALLRARAVATDVKFCKPLYPKNLHLTRRALSAVISAVARGNTGCPVLLRSFLVLFALGGESAGAQVTSLPATVVVEDNVRLYVYADKPDACDHTSTSFSSSSPREYLLLKRPENIRFTVWEIDRGCYRITPPDYPVTGWIGRRSVRFRLRLDLPVDASPPYLAELETAWADYQADTIPTVCAVLFQPHDVGQGVFPVATYKAYRQRDRDLELHSPQLGNPYWIPRSKLDVFELSPGGRCSSEVDKSKRKFRFTEDNVFYSLPSTRSEPKAFYKTGETIEVSHATSHGWLYVRGGLWFHEQYAAIVVPPSVARKPPAAKAPVRKTPARQARPQPQPRRRHVTRAETQRILLGVFLLLIPLAFVHTVGQFLLRDSVSGSWYVVSYLVLVPLFFWTKFGIEIGFSLLLIAATYWLWRVVIYLQYLYGRHPFEVSLRRGRKTTVEDFVSFVETLTSHQPQSTWELRYHRKRQEELLQYFGTQEKVIAAAIGHERLQRLKERLRQGAT